MAKVAAEGLPWLSKPSTGYDLFTKPTFFTPPSSDGDETGVSPKRLVTTRGSELFVGQGNEVRCADLQDLKARHPDIAVSAEGAKKVGHREHKVLNLPQLDFEIRQLEVSYDDLYLAVVGERDIAVCVLPGEGFLKREAVRPIVPHFHRIGKGYHNSDSGARIVRVLWHPLGVEGASLIVLTADGYVRTYDFTIGSEVSFEVPDQTLDLYVLSGRNRHTGGFAADQDEMMPASCCFGSGDQGWRPFTLYILMRSGDIYALNPVVPSRWMASRESIQRLSLEITAELEGFNELTSPEHKSTVRHQTKWINDILNQETTIANAYNSFSFSRGSIPTCLKRPEVVGPSPVLQGPFLFEPAPQELQMDDCPAACDIFHLEAGPVGVIGTVYSHGKLDICLEFEPLPAKWVDKKRKFKAKALEDQSDLPVIASYETINLGIQAGNNSEYSSWPTFTRDPHSTQLWFVNHISGVVAFSMKAWLGKLETVLDDEEDDGFLARILERSPRSQVQKVVDTARRPVDGCTVVYEAYIGYLLIAGYQGGLSSVEFDEPLGATAFSFEDPSDTITLQPPLRHNFTESSNSTPRASRFQTPGSSSTAIPEPSKLPQPSLPAVPKVSILQPPYQPSPEFAKPSTLPQFLRNQNGTRSPIMFSSTSLAAFQQARDILKTEYDALMSGAQEMHDRAAAQRLEYNKQLETLHSTHSRLGGLMSRGVRDRLERFIARQEDLQRRADVLLRRLILESEVGLSNAEKRWTKEVERMSERVFGDDASAFGSRTLRVCNLIGELLPEAQEDQEGAQVERDTVPGDIREGKLKALKALLDREDALVSGTRRRLEGLLIETERV